jgi:hypothetical protein
MSEMQPIGNFLQVVGQMAQIKPEILDKVDEDKTVDVIADLMSVTPEILRSEEVVKQIREARKAEQQQQLQLMKLEQASKIAKQGADANKSMQEAGAK